MTDLILTEDDYRTLVQAHHGEPTTDSLKVASKFGKRHDTVLRAIDNLKSSAKFNRRNFAEITYIDDRGRSQRMFTMTKDGFMFLVMGFTGSKAGVWKERFIEAFNWLIDQLANHRISFDQRRNQILLEYNQEKGLASFAGKTMRGWQLKKPVIEGELLAIEQHGQGVLQLH